MAQAGMYVASSKFIYKPYKYLFTRIRNNDNLYAGLSSFEVEMKEFKVILKYADNSSIILGDELASGTNTEDATAIVASGIIELSKRESSFLFATHLHFLAEMKCIKELDNIRLCHLLVERDKLNPKKLIYNRTLLDGNGPKSYGILVCEAMNMDNDFLIRAKHIRENISNCMQIANTQYTNNTNTTNTNNTNTNNTNTNNTNNTNTLHTNTLNINIDYKYNNNKTLALCEICNNTSACDIHHISQQCDANACGLIDNYDYGIFNKNKLWNLIALCKTCHQAIHCNPSKLNVNGYITTSNGIELQFNWHTNNTDTSNSNSISISDNKHKLKPKHKPNPNYKEEITIDDTIKNIIIQMKLNNKTPKKIQFDIKRYHNIDISQHFIRDIET